MDALPTGVVVPIVVVPEPSEMNDPGRAFGGALEAEQKQNDIRVHDVGERTRGYVSPGGLRAGNLTSVRGVESVRPKRPHVDVRGVLSILNSLYPNKAFALARENLQNSIDAGARTVWVDVDSEKREARFADDGKGIPLSQMNGRQYFALRWSTKRGSDSIGSKGIGRLTNIAAARRVYVWSNDGSGSARFVWFNSGGFSECSDGASPLDHPGLSLHLEGLRKDVANDLPRQVVAVATGVFDDWLRRGTSVLLNGSVVRPKEYRGRRSTHRLRHGVFLEMYWDPEGQLEADRAMVLKCRGVRVGAPQRLGVESFAWKFTAGILHLDDFPLTTNREAFEETPELRAVLEEAGARVRSFFAMREGIRTYRRNAMADRYTRAARQAAMALGIAQGLPGVTVRAVEHEPKAEATEGGRAAVPPVPGLPAEPASSPPSESPRSPAIARSPRESNPSGTFRLVPLDFRTEPGFEDVAEEVSTHRGAAIYVNLSHRACPSNRHARSWYIWSVGFLEMLRWGALGGTGTLDKERAVEAYRRWIESWNPELARYTPGSD